MRHSIDERESEEKENGQMEEWYQEEMKAQEKRDERIQKELDENGDEEHMEWYEKLGYQGAVVDLVSDHLEFDELLQTVGQLLNHDGIESDGEPVLTDEQKLDAYVEKMNDYKAEDKQIVGAIHFLNQADASKLDEMTYIIELVEKRCETLTVEVKELLANVENDLEEEEERRNA